jgi:hypothetical protein
LGCSLHAENNRNPKIKLHKKELRQEHFIQMNIKGIPKVSYLVSNDKPKTISDA